jgi:hypothetical protein
MRLSSSFSPFTLSTTLLTGMTGISLHLQWSLASQPHGSFLKENDCFFVTDQTRRPIIWMFQRFQILPWYSGYAEAINAGKSLRNEDQVKQARLLWGQTGWPDEFGKKITQNVAQYIFCQN